MCLMGIASTSVRGVPCARILISRKIKMTHTDHEDEANQTVLSMHPTRSVNGSDIIQSYPNRN